MSAVGMPGPSKSSPDLKQMFLLAEQYTEASCLLENQLTGDDPLRDAPRLLVDSFAVELYLKCLHVQDHAVGPHGHDWQKLFDSLKPATKTAVREAFGRIIENNVVLRHLQTINPGAAMVLDFERSLAAAKNTFDKRRYLYEPPPTGEWFYAHLLRDAVRAVVCMDPRLGQVKKTMPKMKPPPNTRDAEPECE